VNPLRQSPGAKRRVLAKRDQDWRASKRSGRALRCAPLLWLLACGSSEAPEPAGLPGYAPEVRPDTPGNMLQFNFEPGDTVVSFDSPGGDFKIHYTLDGPNAVDATDDDTSGTPDFVEEVAAVYDEVGDYYAAELGFKPPIADDGTSDNGGDERFDVYLVDFAGVGDGNFRQDACTGLNPEQCNGFMTQENDYVGYGYPSTLIANRILGSHEFFHAVQAAYDVDQGSVLSEGTAVWATESFDPSLGDFEAFLDGYLENTDRPVDEPLPGPVDPFSYGSAIFFWFLEEAYGAGMVRALWENSQNGADGVDNPYWLDVLEPTLQAEASVSFADAFTEFARWNLFTGNFDDPAESYDAGGQYPRVRIDDEALPPPGSAFQENALRTYYASSHYLGFAPDGRAAMTAALVDTAAEPDATTDMRLILATELSPEVTALVVDDPTAGTQTIDTSDAQRLVVVVINTATAGDSKKPGVCVGTVEEVAACRELLAAGTGGMGGNGGAGGAGGSLPADGGGGGETDGDDGCSCRVGPRSSDASALWLVALALGAGAALRRRIPFMR
jgi:MYXO-CTERM domain-containing protein